LFHTCHIVSALGRAAAERSEFNADRTSFPINVRLRRNDAQRAHSAQRGDAIVNRMCQRFLEIISAGIRQLLNLLAKEIEVPGEGRIVAVGGRDMNEPDLD